jgi:hypothetical protein
MSPKLDYQRDEMKSRIMERLSVMKKQEESTRRRNYFLDLPMMPSAAYIDAKCRRDMIEWTITVAQYFGFDNTTVLYGIDYVDRFLASSSDASLEAVRSRHIYQLTCMTCFYMAVKLHEPKMIDMSSLVELGRKSYTKQEFKKMEETILFALNFRMMTPTPMCFANVYLELTALDNPMLVNHTMRKNVEAEIYRLMLDETLISLNYSEIAVTALASCTKKKSIERSISCKTLAEPEMMSVIPERTSKIAIQ